MDTLQHFIFSSLPSPDVISGHKYPQLEHYEGKADIVRYVSERGESDTFFLGKRR